MIESGLERMKAIADMLGVELGEEFDIGESPFNPYEITEDGLLDRNGSVTSVVLKDLLVGNRTITKRPKAPWEPRKGERYWYVSENGSIRNTGYVPDTLTMDAYNRRAGNCFPDKETAEANRDIMLNKFNTRELTPASWTPETGEKYWFFNHVNLCSVVWTGSLIDHMFRDVGNFYRTEAEALADYPSISKRLGMPESNA